MIYIGGMVSSDTVEYADGSGKGLLRNPVVKIMQMVWRYCDGGDKAKHAAQNPPTVTEVIYRGRQSVPHIRCAVPGGYKARC